MDFRTKLEADPEVLGHLSSEQLADWFAIDLHQANLGVIWERLGI
jgi:adenylosuccinate lyase